MEDMNETTAPVADPTAVPEPVAVQAAQAEEEVAAPPVGADDWSGWDEWDGKADGLPEHVRGWYSRFDARHQEALASAASELKKAARDVEHWRQFAMVGGDDPRITALEAELAEARKGTEGWDKQRSALEEAYAEKEKLWEAQIEQTNAAHFNLLTTHLVPGMLETMGVDRSDSDAVQAATTRMLDIAEDMAVDEVDAIELNVLAKTPEQLAAIKALVSNMGPEPNDYTALRARGRTLIDFAKALSAAQAPPPKPPVQDPQRVEAARQIRPSKAPTVSGKSKGRKTDRDVVMAAINAAMGDSGRYR